MFGDFSAWAYEYVGGIRLLGPGFSRIALRPHLPAGVQDFEVRHETPHGTIVVALKRESDGEVKVRADIPAGIVVEDGVCDAPTGRGFDSVSAAPSERGRVAR